MALVIASTPTRTVTALDMIKRAYRLIGVYSLGETPSADETVDGLAAMNAMLDSWANEKLMVYAPSLDVITLVPSQSAYTIGPTGGTVSPRPQSIDDATYLVYAGVSYPIEVITLAQYNSIALKGLTTDIPQALWYRPDYPNGTITLYPVPTVAMTLNLWSWKWLAGFSSATTQITLPPGYEDAIVYNLAEALAPENEVQPPATVVRKAMLLKKQIKRTNFKPLVMGFRAEVSESNNRFNIYSGS